MENRIPLLLVTAILSTKGFAKSSSCITLTSGATLEAASQLPADAFLNSVPDELSLKSGSFGPPTTARWFRINVDIENCKENYYWQIHSLDIQSAKFWQVKDGQVHTLGEHQGFSDTHQYFPYRNWPIFQIDTTVTGINTLYLRVESTNRISINYDFMTKDQRQSRELGSQIIFLSFLGICLGLSLYNLWIYSSLRDPTYLRYIGFSFASLLGLTISEGNMDWLLPLSGSWLSGLNIVIAGIVYLRIATVRAIIPLDLQAPNVDRYLVNYSRSVPALVILDLIPPAKALVNTLLVPYIAITLAICMSAALVSYRKEYKLARFMIAAWGGGCLLITLKFITDLGFAPETFLSIHTFKVMIIFELSCLAMILANKMDSLRRDIRRINETLEGRIEDRIKYLKESHDQHQKNQAYVIEQEKFAALGRLADTLAHEVNTPLMIIRTGANILANHKSLSPEILTRRTEQIERAVDKIEKIIKALTITYLNPVNQKGNEVSINDFLQSIVDLHQGLCVEHEIQLSTEISEKILIKGNPVHLADVISEVFVASMDAVCNLKEKWIEIKVSRIKNDIVVAIKDSCTGSEKDPRSLHYENITAKGSDQTLLKNAIEAGVNIGIAHEVIRFYGGTLKFIQNDFYSLTTIKFPIDIDDRKYMRSA